eukprot:IDg11723t1
MGPKSMIFLFAAALALHTAHAAQCTCKPLTFSQAWSADTPFARARVMYRVQTPGDTKVTYKLKVEEIYGHCVPDLPRLQKVTTDECPTCCGATLNVGRDVYVALRLDGSATEINSCSAGPHSAMSHNNRRSIAAIPTLPCLNPSYYSSLSDQALWRLVTGWRNIGGCRIMQATDEASCDLYVLTRYGGWPKDAAGWGDGCVFAPKLLKDRDECKYSHGRFRLSLNKVDAFCSGNENSNALNMLRHALDNGVCDISL